MSYSREPNDYHPAIRSPAPSRFPEYSLWGDSFSFDLNQGPERSIYPQRRADNASRPYYHSANDHPRSFHNQRGDRLSWPPFTTNQEERPINFRKFSPRDDFTRSPNQFTAEPLSTDHQFYHNVSQYDEQFSVPPQRREQYCRSPLQATSQFSEDPKPHRSMYIQRPQFASPTGRSNESRYTNEPFSHYNKDTNHFLVPTEPQHQFPSRRSDDCMRSPLPSYNSTKYTDYQPQNQSYRLRSPLQRPNEHTRSPFPTSEMHSNSRLPPPLQRPVQTRSFPAPEMHNSSRNCDEDALMSTTRPFRFRSPQRPAEHSRTSQPEQQNNSMDYADASYNVPLPKSQELSNTQTGEDIPQVLIPDKNGTPKSETVLSTDVQESSNNMIPVKDEDVVIDKIPKPEVSLEEEDIVVIERKSLYLHPDNFKFDNEVDVTPPEPQEHSSSSPSGEWTCNIFKREGSPSFQSDQPSRVLPRKANSLNRKLLQALSKPVVMEKGAKMMHRMGWIGGGLGKDGTGIVNPIAPNAVYATTTVGFGQEVKAIQRFPTKRENRSPCIKRNKSKKVQCNSFKTNVLLHILKFVTDDMKMHLYFDSLLKSSERKRIHKIVQAIVNKDTNMQFGPLLRIVEDIRKYCQFTLNTLSDGEDEERMISVYKGPTDKMFVVTPDDCRPCLTDINMDEEESNPFLKSINNHIKADPEATPAPTHLIDKLVKLFQDFSKMDDLTEFRFLGPFTEEERTVINYFFTLIDNLSQLCKPDCVVPNKLQEVFDAGHRYHTEMDLNGFISIQKVDISKKQENEKT